MYHLTTELIYKQIPNKNVLKLCLPQNSKQRNVTFRHIVHSDNQDDQFAIYISGMCCKEFAEIVLYVDLNKTKIG